MVAYSFKKQFSWPIKIGLGSAKPDSFGAPLPKRQTIRALGKRRHARAGEMLQLYTGMRTKQCQSIGIAKCTQVRDIVITFKKPGMIAIGGTEMPDGEHQKQAHYAGGGLNDFARKDGFRDWADMVEFWRKTHGTKKGGLRTFVGVLIEWEPIA